MRDMMDGERRMDGSPPQGISLIARRRAAILWGLRIARQLRGRALA